MIIPSFSFSKVVILDIMDFFSLFVGGVFSNNHTLATNLTCYSHIRVAFNEVLACVNICAWKTWSEVKTPCLPTKSPFYISRAVSYFYETEFKIWSGFWAGRQYWKFLQFSWSILLLRMNSSCFHGQIKRKNRLSVYHSVFTKKLIEVRKI